MGRLLLPGGATRPLHVVSWNVCGADLLTVSCMIDIVSREVDWSFILPQEVSVSDDVKPSCQIPVGSHTMYVGNTSWRACAVIVHCGVAHSVVTSDLRSAYPLVVCHADGLEMSSNQSSYVVASAHLPHSNHSDADFQDAVSCLSLILSRSCRSRVIVGLDANICLPVSDSEPLVVANSPHPREANARMCMVEALLQAQHARVMNSHSDTPVEQLYTHKHWVDGALSMRDFIWTHVPCTAVATEVG